MAFFGIVDQQFPVSAAHRNGLRATTETREVKQGYTSLGYTFNVRVVKAAFVVLRAEI